MIDALKLSEHILNFSRIRAFVVGDVLIDTYMHGSASRISPEFPVPIIDLSRREQYLGGAGNVAANCRLLGAACRLFTVIGDDSESQQIVSLANNVDVELVAIIDSTRPTPTKHRVMVANRQLLRLDHELSSTIQPSIEQKLIAALKEQPAPEVLIVADYAKGVITEEVMQLICQMKPRPLIVVDPKRANFSFYAGCDIIKPNRIEAAGAANCSTEDLFVSESLHRVLQSMPNTEMVVTCGDEGMRWVRPDGSLHEIATRSQKVFDVTGAGDTAAAALALSLASGASVLDACHIANVAAGIAVSHNGTYAVHQAELLQEILTLQTPGTPKLMRTCIAQRLRAVLRRDNRTVVLTNGCFDLAHPGHLQLLARAKSFGDFLFVAINSDDSVRRLKGNGRPIMTLDERVAVLSAFSFVDGIIAYDEDTPEAIIRQLQPDVLVKGNQYRLDEVVGAGFVRSVGGRVELIPMVSQCSTTSIIARITANHQQAGSQAGIIEKRPPVSARTVNGMP